MQSINNWSLTSKLAAFLWGMTALGITAYVLEDTSPVTRPVQSGRASLMDHSPAAGQSRKAPFVPRILTPVGMAADKTLRDDHWGECPAFTHYHESVKELNSRGEHATPLPDYNRGFLVAPPSDGLCHDDKTDEPIKERPTLPKPKFKPNKKAVWA